MQKNNPIHTHTNPLLSASTQLWIGQHDATLAHITELLQKLFCKNSGCNTCIICMQIRDQQHHAICWFEPEKSYTKDQFDQLFSILALAREPDEHYFFVIQKADFLPMAAANRLLKSLEEPPHGYHFILLAEREDQLLPTITSRCVINTLSNAFEIEHHPLFNYLSNSKTDDPSQFLKTLDTTKISERESIELLDELLKHWIKKYRHAITHHHEQAQQETFHAIAILKKSFKQPPMPGSSKIFWKNVYLQLTQPMAIAHQS